MYVDGELVVSRGDQRGVEPGRSLGREVTHEHTRSRQPDAA